MSSFERRLIQGDQHRDVELKAGQASWIAAQEHRGENIGSTGSHSLFVVEQRVSRPLNDEGSRCR